MKVYKALATALSARKNCKKSGNTEWYDRHTERIEKIMKTAPSGSGFDSGTQLHNNSRPGRLVFAFGYHHMDDNGFYCGWTHHRVIVVASLSFDFTITITPGVSRQEIVAGLWETEAVEVEDPVEDYDLDYFYDEFNQWLNEEVKETTQSESRPGFVAG